MTGAIDDLRADVEREVAEHKWILWIGACEGCNWRGFSTAHAAHVSERVMAMLAEKGLREERALHPEFVEDVPRRELPMLHPDGPLYAKHIEWQHRTRLVTDWRTDTDSAEGDVRRAATQVAQHPAHGDTDEGDSA